MEKAFNHNPNDGEEGCAAAVGGGLQANCDSLACLVSIITLRFASSELKHEEANAGARYTIMRPVKALRLPLPEPGR